MKKILVIAEVDLANQKYGLSYRYQQLAKLFGNDFSLTFAYPQSEGNEVFGFPSIKVSTKSIEKIILPYDIIIFTLHIHAHWILLAQQISKTIIIDSYNLFYFEHEQIVKTYNTFMNRLLLSINKKLFQFEIKHANNFFVSNLSQMQFIQEISPKAKCIELPLDIKDDDSKSSDITDDIKQLFKTKKVVVFGGGIWPWYDYDTLIQGFKEAYEKTNDIVLFFLSSENPYFPHFSQQIIDLAKKEIPDAVKFNDTWLSLGDRKWIFENSFLGINVHPKSNESKYSYRTRVKDYLMHSLPVVTTEGGGFASKIKRFKCGKIHKYGDHTELANNIISFVENKEEYKLAQENAQKFKDFYSKSGMFSFSQWVDSLPKDKTPKAKALVFFMWLFLLFSFRKFIMKDYKQFKK